MDTLIHNNLRCLYWGSFSQDMADRFVKEHLLNPEEFGAPLPLPSVAVNDVLFHNAPENNWSGQCEGLTYQRAILALERYGYFRYVTELGKKLFATVIKNDYQLTQQYDPFAGEASRVGMYSHAVLKKEGQEAFQDSYGPTILSVLEYLAHIYGVHFEKDEIWFSLASSTSSYEYEVEWMHHSYRIESDGKNGFIYLDGKLLFFHSCGVRIITDREGNYLKTVSIE